MVMNGKTILITGGTGSFGQAFVGHLLSKYKKIKKIVIFSRDELKQFNMEKLYPIHKYPCMRYFIGDVRDKSRLQMAFREVDIVVHAAALKQVGIGEYNPTESVKTNINGSQNIIEAALDSNVQKVVALSTDKAVSPVNLYGATKLCSEKLFIAANNLKGFKKINFSVVRYGNVMGSRGSVLPYFLKLYEQGIESLPLTDEAMTRFNLSLQDASKVVEKIILKESSHFNGEIFIPKLVNFLIKDLVEAIDSKLKYNIVGIRPGEKIHEELINMEESKKSLEFKDSFLIYPNLDLDDVSKLSKKTKGKNSIRQFSYNSSSSKFRMSVAELRRVINQYKTEKKI